MLWYGVYLVHLKLTRITVNQKHGLRKTYLTELWYGVYLVHLKLTRITVNQKHGLRKTFLTEQSLS